MAAARQLFADRGYAGTSLEEVVSLAGVTRGALYHHYRDKADLLRAVVDSIDAEVLDDVLAAAGPTQPAVAWIRRAALAYVKVSSRLRLSRIGAELPAVLGPEEYRRISQARCLPIVVAAGRAASEAGAAIPGDPEIMAALILAALDEAVGHYSVATTRARREKVLATTEALITGVLRID